MDLITTLVLLIGFAIISGVLYSVINKTLDQLNDTIIALVRRAEAPPQVVEADGKDNSNALRLQACERLTLMLERINVPNLLLRLPPGTGVSAKEHTAVLLMTIREEFEYNVTQQIYVSDALWSIMIQARDNVSQLIIRAAEGAETGEQVASRLRLMSSRQPDDAIGLGQAAIRREASLVL
ncbi:hypothetical protein FUA23_05645 [Neolewinella aurantiaca]|uniref:Uncharacterized protein n=1 Tax=Neolewinella aurantiaca TaxID=2602767 RepID=A0A5C7FZ75_9BACT|nr:hypothetical protein [Neolewinella aurantiaca]TXF90580.1 hypothetical protein FUA23_05645 [Neolewinella aurantiaca]